MIVILKENPDPQQLENLTRWLKSMNLGIHVSEGAHEKILGLIGDTTRVDIDLIMALDIVADVKRIQEPYKNANRKFHPLDTVVDISGVKLGGGNFQMIAGPCSVESEEQVTMIAEAVKKAGATLLRGGGFKPRPELYYGKRESDNGTLVEKVLPLLL